MTESNLTTTYKYDQYGYYESSVTTQIIDGKVLKPPRCIEAKPEFLEGFFYKINNELNGWEPEKKPTSAEECLNLHIKHEDNSDRGCELKKLMQDFCDADSEHYRVKRGEDLSWSVEAIPPKTFEEVKADKVRELQTKSASFETNLNKDMYFKSSLGFKCNGDRRTKDNLQDLIMYFDAQTKATVAYRDYDNQMQQLNKEQLQTLLREHIENGQDLYNQKWELENRLNQAHTIEDLNAINIVFTMKDFTVA